MAVVRLARYNEEHDAPEGEDKNAKGVAVFAGIPTPGAAGLIAGMVMAAYAHGSIFNFKPMLIALPPVCFLLGALMVSRVPYSHFGTTFLQGRRGFNYLFLLVFLIAVMMYFPEACAMVGFSAYALSGPVMMIRNRGKNKPPDGIDPGGEPMAEPSVQSGDGA